MHPSANWEHISRPPGTPIPQYSSGRGWPGEPIEGDLFPVALQSLCQLLAQHTSTPEHCWFGVWDGWGWWEPGSSTTLVAAAPAGTVQQPIETAPPELRLNPNAPRFSLPWREYLLYKGAVLDGMRFGYQVGADSVAPMSPNLFWPGDHAWCVATPIDFDTTLVGGSQPLIEAIAVSASLEAMAIQPDAPYRDQINT